MYARVFRTAPDIREGRYYIRLNDSHQTCVVSAGDLYWDDRFRGFVPVKVVEDCGDIMRVRVSTDPEHNDSAVFEVGKRFLTSSKELFGSRACFHY